MRKVVVGLLGAALTSGLLAAPASAKQCNPKLQGVCNAIHDARCTVAELRDAVEIDGVELPGSTLCTI